MWKNGKRRIHTFNLGLYSNFSNFCSRFFFYSVPISTYHISAFMPDCICRHSTSSWKTQKNGMKIKQFILCMYHLVVWISQAQNMVPFHRLIAIFDAVYDSFLILWFEFCIHTFVARAIDKIGSKYFNILLCANGNLWMSFISPIFSGVIPSYILFVCIRIGPFPSCRIIFAIDDIYIDIIRFIDVLVVVADIIFFFINIWKNYYYYYYNIVVVFTLYSNGWWIYTLFRDYGLIHFRVILEMVNENVYLNYATKTTNANQKS